MQLMLLYLFEDKEVLLIGAVDVCYQWFAAFQVCCLVGRHVVELLGLLQRHLFSGV